MKMAESYEQLLWIDFHAKVGPSFLHLARMLRSVRQNNVTKHDLKTEVYRIFTILWEQLPKIYHDLDPQGYVELKGLCTRTHKQEFPPPPPRRDVQFWKSFNMLF